LINECIAGGGVTCTENADGESLQYSFGTGVNGSDEKRSFDIGQTLSNFSITLTGLTTGTYSLSLNANTSVNVGRIPEPGTIGLLGAALAGLGFAGRRKGKQA
jgi:hypothetical protein